MSGYGGPVVPIEFFHHPAPDRTQGQKKRNITSDGVEDTQPVSLRAVTEARPVVDSPSRTNARVRSGSTSQQRGSVAKA
jgi:hypothetical protein